MKAIAAYPGSDEPRLIDAPEPPAPEAGQVLVESLQLGICGTDREILHCRRPQVPTGQDFLVLGHECLGRIKEVGPNLTAWSKGDHVIPLVRRAIRPTSTRVDYLPPSDFIERGIYRADGFSAPLWLDDASQLLRVPSEVLDFSVLAEPIAVAEKAIREATSIQRGRLGSEAWSVTAPRVLVSGLGPIAFATLLVTRAQGWGVTLTALDSEDSKSASLVGAFGGDYFELKRIETIAPEFDLVVECTGSEHVLLDAATKLAPCGVLAWLGCGFDMAKTENQFPRLMREGILGNHVLIGCVNAAPFDMESALTRIAYWRAQNRSALSQLITKRVGLEDSLWDWRYREPHGIKVVIEFE